MIVETSRSLIGRFTRRLPYFPGLGMGYRGLNWLFNRYGANPIAEVRMKNGTFMKVDLRTPIEIDAYYLGEYDPDLIRTVLSLLNVDDMFLDVGANIGFYSVAVAAEIQRRHGEGCVVAFEPFAANVQRLVDNLERNQLTQRVQIYDFGLSNRSREEVLILREDLTHGSNTGNASIAISEEFDHGLQKIRIEVDTLDRVWVELAITGKRIGIIKVDIEGHEDFFLEGASETLSCFRPSILMEVNKDYYEARGVNLDRRFLTLLPHDYQAFVRSDQTWQRFSSFRDCRSLDNVFFIPSEKAGQGPYQIFQSKSRNG